MTDKITAEGEVSGENLLPETEKKKVKLEKIELGNENSDYCNDKIAENNNTELKQEVSVYKANIKRVLSEGEASSGFETVSSLDSNIDPDDFVLSSTADEDDFNVVVQIENELAFQSRKASNERTFYWGITKKTPDKFSNKTNNFLSDYTNKRYDEFRISNREQKLWPNYKYDEYKDNEDKIDKKFSNRETFTCTRRYSAQEYNWDKTKDDCSKHLWESRSGHDSRPRHNRGRPKSSRPRHSRSSSNDSRTRCSRSSDHGSRQRYSRSSDYDSRARGSGSSDYNPRSEHSGRIEQISSSRSLRNSERTNRHNSKEKLAFEDRKTEGRHSRSFSENLKRSNLKRNSTSRKRKRSSFSKSPTSPDRKSKKNSRKKERTPFLIELERKLKEADRLKGSKTELINGNIEKTEVLSDITDKLSAPEVRSKSRNPIAPPDAPVPEMSSNTTQDPVLAPNPPLPEVQFGTTQNPTAPQLSMPGVITPYQTYQTTYNQPAPSIPSVGFPYQYAFPIKSVNNLPLVLGPTGVPVHITLTGEQIPHDFEGRPIPVGPNGFYLPLDPTGRLFPHIVSPGNQAVPIHMSEDGVLRLPNSDPVPYGPPHKLPVNIDGMVIPIGPDSKPLYPCPGLPREPPLHLLRMIGTEPIPPQQISQATKMGNQKTVPTSGGTQEKISSQDSSEALKIESALVHIIQNPFGKVNKANLLKNYKKKVRERCEDVLKCIEIEKNLGVNPSKGGVKRSTPRKMSQKKSPVQDPDMSGSDMVLDSDDPESTSSTKPKKGSTEEIVLSDEEQNILKDICETPNTTNTNAKAKPKDLIAKKVQQAIKSLCERSYKPPVFGRFIISKQMDPVLRKSPNESPLLRNRILLPFLTPNIPSSHPVDEPVVEENTEITFKFLSQKVTKIGEKLSDTAKCEKNSDALKNPVFTFDLAVQCDFTTVIINKLKKKVAELEAEVVRLRNKNAELLDDYRNVQTMNEDKNDELRKAFLQVRKRKTEIQTLRGSFRKRGK